MPLIDNHIERLLPLLLLLQKFHFPFSLLRTLFSSLVLLTERLATSFVALLEKSSLLLIVALLEKFAASLVSLLEDKRLAEISGDELREVPLGDEVHEEVTRHLLPLVLLHHSLH